MTSLQERVSRLAQAIPPLLLLALLLQTLFVLRFLTPGAMLSGEPIVTEDYPLHYYNFLRFRDALLHGKLHQYDPFFALGQGGALWDLTRGQDMILLGVLFFWMGPLAVFKLYLLLANLTVPLLACHASKTLGFNKRASSLAAVLAVVSWQFIGAIHHMLYSGVFSFVLGSLVAVVAASHAFAYAKEGRRRDLLLFLATALLAFAMHRLHLLTLALFVMTIAAITGEKRALRLCAGFLLALAALLFAYRGAIAYQFTALDVLPFHQSGGLAALGEDAMTSPLLAWMLLAGLAGIVLARKGRALFRWGLVSFLLLFLMAYFGSSVSLLRYFQPQRMLVPLLLLSTPFAGYALSEIRLPLRWRPSAAVPLALLLAIALVPAKHLGTDVREEWVRQLSTALPQDTEGLIAWMRDSTEVGDRILIENSGYRSGFVFGGHTFPLIVLEARRELVGVPYPYPQVQGGTLTTDFSEGRLFNRECRSFSAEELAELLSLFDVRWVVGWSDEGTSCLRGHPSLLVETEQIGRFSVFRANQSSGRFLEGSGTVSATYDRMSLSNLSKGRIVLNYRYAPWLTAGEGIALEESPLEAGIAYRGFLALDVTPGTAASDITT